MLKFANRVFFCNVNEKHFPMGSFEPSLHLASSIYAVVFVGWFALYSLPCYMALPRSHFESIIVARCFMPRPSEFD